MLQGRERCLISPDDEEFFLKLYAVHGGPLVVASVRDYFDRRHLLRVPSSDLSQEQRKARTELLRVHVAVLARSGPPADAAVKQYLELAVLADRMERDHLAAEELTRPLRPTMSCQELLADLQQGEQAVDLSALADPAAQVGRCA